MRCLLVIVLLLEATAGSTAATDWYVDTAGQPTGRGTADAPWDITSALGGKRTVAPGDTIWIRGGTYKIRGGTDSMGYEIRLVGTASKPVHVRPLPGQRVIIDGGLDVVGPSAYLWIWDLEIVVSEKLPAAPAIAPSTRPVGGLNVHAGAGSKYINLVIHDNCEGVGFWRGARDSELYGCLIYNNGWPCSRRAQLHNIYTQNWTGTKKITNCIITGGRGYSVHAYGVRGYVNNYVLEANICYNAGKFLVGGQRPSRNIRVRRNYLHRVSMLIGQNGPRNDDCEVVGNVVDRGTLEIQAFRRVREEDNLVLGASDRRRRGARIFVVPNRYNPHRYHVAVFNWTTSRAVGVRLDKFLKSGDGYRLMDPTDFFGKPVVAGKYRGGAIRIPVAGEFAAFVLLVDGGRRQAPPETSSRISPRLTAAHARTLSVAIGP